MAYNEDEMLMLSGIQHYMFCPRQWALIHCDQQWEDNKLTVEGNLLHHNVDNPSYRQKNGETITLRFLRIASKSLGLYGITDAVELHKSPNAKNAIHSIKYPGEWTPFVIEYKHGKEKSDETDEVQLAAQMMCLEEMYSIRLETGAIFYGESLRRSNVTLSESLRERTINCAKEMHQLFNNHILPKAIKKAKCKSCSLFNLCLPEINKCTSVETYLKNNLYETVT